MAECTLFPQNGFINYGNEMNLALNSPILLITFRKFYKYTDTDKSLGIELLKSNLGNRN